MIMKSIAFIGGGRITAILLEALKRKNIMPDNIKVFDIDGKVLEKLKEKVEEIQIVRSLEDAINQDVIFIALHPPVIKETLEKIKDSISENKIIISLSPKITIASIIKILDKSVRVVRFIPNAPSIINSGYNPVSFSDSFPDNEKLSIIEFLANFGICPEVDEKKLESYAILTAMGPTYFWFQFQKLLEISQGFGLSEKESKEGLISMLKGAIDLFESHLTYEEVIDLIPVKPLAKVENDFIDKYEEILKPLYERIKAI